MKNQVSETALSPVYRYFAQVRQILFQPTQFFKKLPLEGNMTLPLVFALVTSWIGSALTYISQSAFGLGMRDFYNRMMDRYSYQLDNIDGFRSEFINGDAQQRLYEWYLGIGPVLIDPFVTVVKMFVVAGIVFLGARLFVTPGKGGSPRSIPYESALRIVCYSSAPVIFGFVPFIGPAVAWIYAIVLSVIAAQEMYRVGTGRAVLIALFPKILLALPFVGLMTVIMLLIIAAAAT